MEELEMLRACFDVLSTREKEVLNLLYGLNGERNHTLEEVAVKFNITRERARQISAKAKRKLLARLKEKLAARDRVETGEYEVDLWAGMSEYDSALDPLRQ